MLEIIPTSLVVFLIGLIVGFLTCVIISIDMLKDNGLFVDENGVVRKIQ